MIFELKDNKVLQNIIDNPKYLAYGFALLMTVLTLFQWMSFLKTKQSIKMDSTITTKVQVANKTKNLVLFSSPLFGEYLSSDEASDIKNSTLSFDIVGILLDSDPLKSQVTLKDPGGKEETYQMGDSLPGGATIVDINAVDIVVRYLGELQRLDFPNEKLRFESQALPLLEDEK